MDDEYSVFPGKLRVSQSFLSSNESPKLRNLLSHSLLLLAKQGNTSYPDDPQWNVYDFKEKKSVRLVVRTIDPLSHPMHLHGHNFWVVAQGTGK